MPEINYVTGDATDPPGDGYRIIAHVCNDVGGWGAGFVVALSARSRKAERAYRLWARYRRDNEGTPFELGQVQFAPFAKNITVANMVAQRGVRTDNAGDPPIRYAALRSCLDKLGQRATTNKATVHMPRIGGGLAGGDWDKVEECILESLIDVYGLSVTVYDLPTAAGR